MQEISEQRPHPRGLYGALPLLKACLRDHESEAEESSPSRRFNRTQASRSCPSVNAWRNVPECGKSTQSYQRSRTGSRLQVARLQETLSQVTDRLQLAVEASSGVWDDETHSVDGFTRTAADHFDHTNDLVTRQREASELEDDATRLQQDEARLQMRFQRLQNERRRLKALPSATKTSCVVAAAMISEGTEVKPDSDLASALSLLSCLQDVALAHRDLIIPADPSKRTRDQQIVDQFLDEVVACQREEAER
eukprot:TRINITY_DN34186_c0_g1_i1.p1 TRINITY_DN34186_c0_g1~~TRINITY_DN34186_c0_g1_i1.p1  ORF type:complete len:251 (+),score=35.79 TRINITY_DN34186_c0_g1_i1:56-808(+)